MNKELEKYIDERYAEYEMKIRYRHMCRWLTPRERKFLCVMMFPIPPMI